MKATVRKKENDLLTFKKAMKEEGVYRMVWEDGSHYKPETYLIVICVSGSSGEPPYEAMGCMGGELFYLTEDAHRGWASGLLYKKTDKELVVV